MNAKNINSNNINKRFGVKTEQEIDNDIENAMPANTKKSRASVWRQFKSFCEEKDYNFNKETTPEELNNILKSWAVNMKKKDGSDYKEMVVKHMWNSTAKLIQDKYFRSWKIKINPFADLCFQSARAARDAKRRKLQALPEKRKCSASALTDVEYHKIVCGFDENVPDGLQKKFFSIAAFELAWRGGEGANCLVSYFQRETDNYGNENGRIEYNPIFSKTAQGGSQPLTDSKWLIPNSKNTDLCPVRLYRKLISKRGGNIKTERMFLTPNPNWKLSNCWYKNCPVGINEINKWIKCGAQAVGLDVAGKKICNHSMRSSAVSQLMKADVGEQELMKITGHSNSNSLKSYLQMDVVHHELVIEKMRQNTDTTMSKTNTTMNETNFSDSQNTFQPFFKECSNVTFNNCTFNAKK